MEIVFLIWFLLVAGGGVWLYRATQFEYVANEQTLQVVLVWGGLFPITKRIPIANIESARRLASIREIIPLASGTFPSLWGKFRPAYMVRLDVQGELFSPVFVTPDDPDQFIARLSSLIQAR